MFENNRQAISIIYSDSGCVSILLGIQNAMRMGPIMSSVACPALQYFFSLFHKWHDFPKSYRTLNVCFDLLYKFCLKRFLL